MIALLTPLNRAVEKNHSRSRNTGPPTAPLLSKMRLTPVAFVMPWSCASWLRLSDCQFPGVKPPNQFPLNWLPPSFGIMLMRSPPVWVSAPCPDVVYDVSAASIGFR